LTSQRAFRSIILLLLLGVLWGSGYSLARYAMTHGVPPLGYAFWQTLGPAVLLSIVAWRSRGGISYQPKHVVFYAVTGLLGIAIPNSTMYFVSSHLPAGLLAVVVNTAPLFTYVIALSLAAERFSWLRAGGVIVCVLGLMTLVFFKQQPLTAMAAPMHWLLLALLSPLCFSSIAVYTSRCRPSNTQAIALAAGMLTGAFILLLPAVLLTHSFYALMPPWQLRDVVIVLEVILSSLGYVVFFRLIADTGPVYYSLVAGVVAVTGLFWGWLFFQEHFNPSQWGAIGLILAGIALVTWKFPKARCQD
jgi:drug/metabolite transporter (DMT)-like permease